jgi:chromosome partitioning protein
MPNGCRTIMLFAPKGGVGKTTISAHLLVAAARDGLRTIGLDFDPQQTLKLWADTRAAHAEVDRLPMFDVGTADIDDWLTVWKHIDDYDLAVIDMPPGFKGHEASIYNMVGRVDYVLIPIGQTRFDQNALVPWMERFLERRLQAAFCINKASDSRWGSFKRTKSDLIRVGPLVPFEIPQREDIHYATESGLTVLDIRVTKGGQEFDGLWSHVRRELHL